MPASGGESAGQPLAYLVHGDDPGLVSQRLTTLLGELTALDDSGLPIVEEYGEPDSDEPFEVGAVLNACRTPPFLASWRIVVVRDVRALDAGAQKDVAAYLSEPLETTVLVLASNGRPPAGLLRAVSSSGVVIEAAPAGNARGRGQWVAEHLRAHDLRLDAEATALLAEHLGEDLARLESVSGTLLAAFGPGVALRSGDISPFLGEAGGVAPWDLTDAIDAGDGGRALDVLHRMLDAGERHPLQVLATLHRHYAAVLRLEGSDITDEATAASATGLGGFPARKALALSRQLGHERAARAIGLLAAADLDVRGAVGWPEPLVMEVLVARLAQLSRQRRSTNTRSRARSN